MVRHATVSRESRVCGACCEILSVLFDRLCVTWPLHHIVLVSVLICTQTGMSAVREIPLVGFGTFNSWQDPEAVAAAVVCVIWVVWKHSVTHVLS